MKNKNGLTKFSSARVGLGHSGGHLKTREWLDFQHGFVLAKDALNSTFNPANLQSFCQRNGLSSMELHCRANTLQLFLLRPDLGRLLETESGKLLQESRAGESDILIIVSGGLSPVAIQNHAAGFLSCFINHVTHEKWSLAPIMVLSRSRVAIGDEINQYIKAKITVMLIGERPGLSTADSMGIYFTYDAKPGCNDSQRNCISNIHKQGLDYQQAADKLAFLLKQAFRQRCTGIRLKDGVVDKNTKITLDLP